jgi:predicted transcriptional regulator
LVTPKQTEPGKQLQPTISIRKSVTPNYLISLEDGKKYKTLKRHLGKLGLTPAQYRAKWGLPDDYPIVAPSYALRRSELARSSGLG